MLTKDSKRPSRFHLTIYTRHIQEASFLYERRALLLNEPYVIWPEVGEVEARFEAHIQALFAGGSEALYVCQERAVEGDCGELHAAVSVFCRHSRLDLIEALLDRFDHNDRQRTLAVRHALKQEWPSKWEDKVEELLAVTPGRWFSTLPKVIGFKRLPAVSALTRLLPICPPAHLAPVIWALGRMKVPVAHSEFFPFLHYGNVTIRAMAALGLLRHGAPLETILPTIDQTSDLWHMIGLALAGSAKEVPGLCGLLRTPTVAIDDMVMTLGILGDIQAIEPLIQQLKETAIADTCAVALNLITGAELYEEVLISEVHHKPKPFSQEIKKRDRGEPLHPMGPASTNTTVRLCQNPGTWLDWWHRHHSRFKAGIRYRNVRPFTPHCLLENIRHEKSPLLVRQFAYEELVVRYGINVDFETDMTVMEQSKSLQTKSVILEKRKNQWDEGRWYYAGHPIG
jgi:hypothetical protein